VTLVTPSRRAAGGRKFRCSPKDHSGTVDRVSDGRARVLPILAVLAAVVLWASAFVAIRRVGDEVSAGALALARLLVASAVLGAVILVRRKAGDRRPMVWPARAMWPRLLICGVAWFALYNVALNAAERSVDAGTASMLVNVGPVLIAVLAGVLLREGFPAQLVAGSVVAFAGVVVIGMATSAGHADAWGVVLCLVAAAGYAIGVVTQKPLLAGSSALQVTWLAGMVGAVACLPFAPVLVRDLAGATPSTIWWVLYLGALPSAVAFTTWAYALARTSAGRLGAATYLVPPVAIALAWLLLDEQPPALALVGGIICLAGVYLARRPPRRRPPVTPAPAVRERPPASEMV
jgi:drug/metabolite transporter (DMT)-like permease